MEFAWSVKIGVLFSAIYLWVGMLTGVWKYLQIRRSPQARAHYYVDIAHRSSLLYAPAALILAVMAYFSAWQESLNIACVIINLVFFSASILAYIIHGMLKDTQNQFKEPHQLGVWQIDKRIMLFLMLSLIIAELAGTTILLSGVLLAFCF